MRKLTSIFVGVVLVTLVSACAAVQPAGGETPTVATTVSTEHGGHATSGPSGEEAPTDARFIDGMIEHHVGAITMAEQVLATSERPELLALAEAIIAAQTTEIEQMQSWREAWFPELAPTGGMEMDMGDMSISSDASIPFDQRFLQAMISHHEGALHMAEAVLTTSERTEIRTLAENIIATQTAEIAQMREWLAAWFGVSE